LTFGARYVWVEIYLVTILWISDSNFVIAGSVAIAAGSVAVIDGMDIV
jgi:hypothetical protein